MIVAVHVPEERGPRERRVLDALLLVARQLLQGIAILGNMQAPERRGDVALLLDGDFEIQKDEYAARKQQCPELRCIEAPLSKSPSAMRTSLPIFGFNPNASMLIGRPRMVSVYLSSSPFGHRIHPRSRRERHTARCCRFAGRYVEIRPNCGQPRQSCSCPSNDLRCSSQAHPPAPARSTPIDLRAVAMISCSLPATRLVCTHWHPSSHRRCRFRPRSCQRI